MLIESRLKKQIIAIVMALFLVLNFFGVLHMGMSDNGKMDGCPFAPGSSLCDMTPLQHIGAAQNLFNNLPSQDTIVYLLFAIVFIALSTLAFFIKIFSPPKLSPAYSRYNKNQFKLAPDFLQQVFAHGILNPKTF